MNLRLAMRWTIAAIAVAASVGRASPQQPPTAEKDKTQKEAQAPAKPESAAPASTSVEQQDLSAPKAEPKAAAPADSQPAMPTIANRKDRVSYAFGADLARDIQRQKDGLNIDLLMRALTDAMAGKKLLLSDEEVSKTVKEFEEEQKLDLQHAKMMIGERNRREGEAFFAENAKKEGVVTLPSGLQYKIIKKGDGKLPTLEDLVLCNYTGKLLDGTEIDSSYKRKEPTLVPVKGLIPGWAQAIQLMPVGTKWEMYLPPQLAYGDKGTPIFGPNATLIFEVELLSIQDKPQAIGALKGKPRAMSHP